MTADQIRQLAQFVEGLNKLTEATGVEISHHDRIGIAFSEGGKDVDLVLSPARGPEGYELLEPYK